MYYSGLATSVRGDFPTRVHRIIQRQRPSCRTRGYVRCTPRVMYTYIIDTEIEISNRVRFSDRPNDGGRRISTVSTLYIPPPPRASLCQNGIRSVGKTRYTITYNRIYLTESLLRSYSQSYFVVLRETVLGTRLVT